MIGFVRDDGTLAATGGNCQTARIAERRKSPTACPKSANCQEARVPKSVSNDDKCALFVVRNALWHSRRLSVAPLGHAVGPSRSSAVCVVQQFRAISE